MLMLLHYHVLHVTVTPDFCFKHRRLTFLLIWYVWLFLLHVCIYQNWVFYAQFNDAQNM